MRHLSVSFIILASALLWVYGCSETPTPTTDEITSQALPDQTPKDCCVQEAPVPEKFRRTGHPHIGNQTMKL